MRQTLSRQHVFDLACANAKSQSAKSPVRRGVTVSANDCHARLSQSQFGSDHVNDPLFGTVDSVKLDAKLAAVAFESVDLSLCDWDRRLEASGLDVGTL